MGSCRILKFRSAHNRKISRVRKGRLPRRIRKGDSRAQKITGFLVMTTPQPNKSPRLKTSNPNPNETKYNSQKCNVCRTAEQTKWNLSDLRQKPSKGIFSYHPNQLPLKTNWETELTKVDLVTARKNPPLETNWKTNENTSRFGYHPTPLPLITNWEAKNTHWLSVRPSPPPLETNWETKKQR